jgi:hypothetical protein
MLRLILVSRRNLTSSQLHGLDVWELDVKVTAKEDITFNRRHTPLDGPFGCQSLSVKSVALFGLSQVNVPYIGSVCVLMCNACMVYGDMSYNTPCTLFRMMAKRMPPSDVDNLTLLAGQSVDVHMDLSKCFQFIENTDYVVSLETETEYFAPGY